MKRNILIALLFLFVLNGFGQKLIELNKHEKFKVILPDQIEVFIDSSNNLEFDQVQEMQDMQFISLKDFTGKFEGQRILWLKLSIKNASPFLGDWLIEVRDLNRVDAYIVDKQKHVEHLLAGDLVPLAEKQIKGGTLSAIKFYLEPHETKTIYLKAYYEIELPVLSAITITDGDSFIRSTTADNLLQGIFQGFLWLMLLYNLFLYITTKQRSYLYYILYVFSFSMVMMFGQFYFHNFIFLNRPELCAHFGAFLFVAFPAYFLLMREFIDAKTLFPKFNKRLQIIILINVIAAIGVLIAQLFNPYNFTRIGLVYVMFNAITLVVCIVFILRKGNNVAKLFAAGTLFLAVCIVISTGLTMAEHYSDSLMILFQVGIAGEVFIFSIGLSYKYKLVEETRQKAQDDLILQLKENDRIKDEANQQLEQKVIERTTELNEEKLKVEQKNRNITDSINYASRIQRALLPSQEAFKEHLPKHFILYKPKDIVSGDFYYLKKKGNKLIVAAADCTGHGVPGAFVSMLGIAFLNEILAKHEINTAAQILDQLRTLVKNSLQQTEDNSQTKDGMDIALCLIDTETKHFQYAGAYNALYIIRNKELIEVKATRNPVGVYIKEKDFTNNEVEIQKGDKFYIFSDGYPDQFSEKDNKKYLTKNFKKLLQEVSDYPFAEQKEMLDKTIEAWKGNKEQNDDMVVIGFEV